MESDEIHYVDDGSGPCSNGLRLVQQQIVDKSLGTWFFDKKTKKRKYIALTGKVYTGNEAVQRAKTDQFSEKNPSRTTRTELRQQMTMIDTSYLKLHSDTLHDAANILYMIANWGIPTRVLARYHKNKVLSLFQWQVECLTVNNCNVFCNNGNLIYSAPTSGGKTLVSELLMLRQLARQPTRSGTIFFVVPFVALADEKTAYFQEMWQDMNIGIKAFHSDDGTGTALPCDVEVAVCTIERANILLTSLLDEGREAQLKMVVIDEIHMLSDSHRGFLLEVFLSKINYLLRGQVQVVGMSATMPNIGDLAGWLGASLYTTTYRPVNLDVRVCFNKTLYRVGAASAVSTVPAATVTVAAEVAEQGGAVNGYDQLYGSMYSTTGTVSSCDEEAGMCVDSLGDNTHSNHSAGHIESAASRVVEGRGSLFSSVMGGINKQLYTPFVPPPAEPSATVFDFDRTVTTLVEDADGMKALCLETALGSGKSVMLFCNSKRRCEVCAQSVASAIHSELSGLSAGRYAARHLVLSDRVRKGRMALVEELGQTQVGLCPTLKATVPHGVAYHHAGLTLDERKIVEDGFRAGFILVLCTTSTLSAGVNLPAHRVIIRSPRMGDKFLNVAAFRQMCGRAGRMGLDLSGEAVLMVVGNRVEKDVASHLVTADLDPLVSTLHVAAGGGLEKLLLELVSCGRLTKEAQVLEFVDCTLMKVQQPHAKVVDFAREALLFLKREQFVQASSSGGELAPSPLGVATTLSGIAPKDAVLILKPLMDARAKLILKGGLHPVFLVTPPSTSIEPDWNNYEKVLDVLFKEHPDARAVAAHLGIEHSQLCIFAFKHPSYNSGGGTGGGSSVVQLYRRFYSAILLFTLIQEWPITRVTQTITNVTRGQLQQLQKDASTFCGMTVVFCKKLNWAMLACCLEDFCARLNHGAHKDILPLVRLGPELTNSRARVLFKNDIASAQDVLVAGLSRITELLVDTLPYDGRDALDITREGVVSSNQINSKQMAHQACERLARKILARARDAVTEELQMMNSQL